MNFGLGGEKWPYANVVDDALLLSVMGLFGGVCGEAYDSGWPNKMTNNGRGEILLPDMNAISIAGEGEVDGVIDEKDNTGFSGHLAEDEAFLILDVFGFVLFFAVLEDVYTTSYHGFSNGDDASAFAEFFGYDAVEAGWKVFHSFTSRGMW